MTTLELLLVVGVATALLAVGLGWRAFKDPDYHAKRMFKRQYIDDQFKKPPNEGDLL